MREWKFYEKDANRNAAIVLDNNTDTLTREFSITFPIFPTRPPPLFPSITIKPLFSEFNINSIVRLAHPAAKLITRAHSRRIAVLFEPLLEVLRTCPTWIKF